MSVLDLFRRRAPVPLGDFCRSEATEALSEWSPHFREYFDTLKVPVRNEVELYFFACTITLIAMSLTKLTDNIQLTFANIAAEQLDHRFQNNAGEQFKKSTLSYLAALDQDISAGNGHVIPRVMTLALERICGTSNESVVRLRLALLNIVMGVMKMKADYYRSLKIAE